jgi:hypothetical protein
MKKLFLFLSLSFSLQAQSDSTNITFSEEKVEKFEKTTLVDEYEKAFGGNRLVKSGLRLYALNPGVFNKQHLGFQFEQKLGKDFSVLASVGNTFQILGSTTFEMSFETKYFFKMKRRINLRLQKPNLNGNFIGLRFGYYPTGYNRFEVDFRTLNIRNRFLGGFPIELFKERQNLSLIVGKQFGNTLSMSFQFGVKSGSNISNYLTGFQNNGKIVNQLFFTSQSQIGVGLLFPKTQTRAKNECQFLRCNTDVKKIWKLNLGNVLYLDKYSQNLELDIAYEKKLKSSPFSLNSNLILNFQSFRVPQISALNDTIIIRPNGEKFQKTLPVYSGKVISQPNLNFSFKEQLRFYPGMKEKVKSGQQGNNLNGIYTGLEYLLSFGKVINSNFYSSYFPIRLDTRALSGIVGYQTLTNRHSFLDVGLAVGVQIAKRFINENSFSIWHVQFHTELSIKLGLAK